MGSNMRRQPVLLRMTEGPPIAVGMERRAAIDEGDVVLAQHDATIEYFDSTPDRPTTSEGRDEHELQKFMP